MDGWIDHFNPKRAVEKKRVDCGKRKVLCKSKTTEGNICTNSFDLKPEDQI